jgi:hypothetical protein
VRAQSNHIQGEWSPKLIEYTPSEDPPKHITKSTKPPNGSGADPIPSEKEKAIADFKAAGPGLIKSIEALKAWDEGEITSEDKARTARVKERLKRIVPDMFNGPKIH